MPTIHYEKFKTRHYECDPTGHLNNAVYLRYMQQAGIEAAASAGFPDEVHFSLNRSWIPRLTAIDHLRAVKYGQSLEIRTWVDGVRRVQSKRKYELRREGSGELVAQAFTDWVFVNLKTNSPVSIPNEIISAFYPEGVPQTSMSRTRFPDAPPPPPKVFQCNRRVEWAYTDPMGHLNNAAYLNYAEDLFFQMLSCIGWPFSRWVEKGVCFSARRNTIEYLKPAFLDDELIISTWIFNLTSSSMTQQYQFSTSDSNARIAQLQTRWVLLDLNRREPAKIPEAFHAAVIDNVASTDESS